MGLCGKFTIVSSAESSNYFFKSADESVENSTSQIDGRHSVPAFPKVNNLCSNTYWNEIQCNICCCYNWTLNYRVTCRRGHLLDNSVHCKTNFFLFLATMTVFIEPGDSWGSSEKFFRLLLFYWSLIYLFSFYLFLNLFQQYTQSIVLRVLVSRWLKMVLIILNKLYDVSTQTHFYHVPLKMVSNYYQIILNILR